MLGFGATGVWGEGEQKTASWSTRFPGAVGVTASTGQSVLA